jgi:tetratricopeptide (TPR) repeat protein
MCAFPFPPMPRPRCGSSRAYNLLYDFWDYEADRAFEESIRADANCAMCYWGLYQAESFNHSETKTYAQASLAKAVALEGHATAREKLYIQACRGPRGRDSRSRLRGQSKVRSRNRDSAHPGERNPSDTNARIALSEAVDDGYDDGGEPRKGKKEELALLQGVLKEEPENSAANHLWIHAVEASPHPEQALHSAEILGSLAPASGHMVHMPGHIFYRTGDYARAQTAFDASAQADESYMRQQHVAPDNDWNYVHNLMYSVANLLEAGPVAGGSAGFGQTGKARGHLEDTLYPWSPRDAIARLNPALPVALRTADWERVVQLVNAANLSQDMPHMEFLAGGLSQFALGNAVGGSSRTRCSRAPLGVARCQPVAHVAADKRPGGEGKEGRCANGNQSMSPDPLPQPLLKMLSIMSLELRASMLATQDNVPEAEKLFARAPGGEGARLPRASLLYPSGGGKRSGGDDDCRKMAGGQSRIPEGAGGASQLRFRALWDRPGEGEERRCRRNHGGLQAVPQRVEDGGPGLPQVQACAAMAEPTRCGRYEGNSGSYCTSMKHRD